jgi:hypothetical protein
MQEKVVGKSAYFCRRRRSNAPKEKDKSDTQVTCAYWSNLTYIYKCMPTTLSLRSSKKLNWKKVISLSKEHNTMTSTGREILHKMKVSGSLFFSLICTSYLLVLFLVGKEIIFVLLMYMQFMLVFEILSCFGNWVCSFFFFFHFEEKGVVEQVLKFLTWNLYSMYSMIHCGK